MDLSIKIFLTGAIALVLGAFLIRISDRPGTMYKLISLLLLFGGAGSGLYGLLAFIWSH